MNDNNTAPFFSIIVPTYNREELIISTLKSILHQSFKNFEVIIIDDGSTDSTKEKLKPYIGNKVTYFYKENGGVSSARNLGIEKSHGEYIAYMDSDDIWENEKLNIIYNKILEHNSPDVLINDLDYVRIGKEEQHSLSNSQYYSYIYESGKKSEPDYFFDQSDFLKLVVKGYPFFPSAMIIKRSTHRDYRWDKDVLKSEDFNLALKLANSCNLLYVDKVLTHIRTHETNKSLDTETKSKVHLASLQSSRLLYDYKEINYFSEQILKQKLAVIRVLVKKKKNIEAINILASAIFSTAFIKLITKKAKGLIK